MVSQAACLILISVFSASASADWSVWDSNKQRSNSVQGQIKAIMINEEDQQIMVSIKRANAQSETFKVCAHDQGSDARNWQQNEKMALMREAFARGDVVKVSYKGSFDRCVSGIEYNSPATTTARKTSGQKDI